MYALKPSFWEPLYTQLEYSLPHLPCALHNLQPVELLRHELGEEVEVPDSAVPESFTTSARASSKVAAQRATSAPLGQGPRTPPVQAAVGSSSMSDSLGTIASSRAATFSMQGRSKVGAAADAHVRLHPAGLQDLSRVAHLIFRGLRLKAGVDAGPVRASVHAALARVTYRGKVGA
jgi:hypothetical protein